MGTSTEAFATLEELPSLEVHAEMIKAITCDLDGTLLDHEARIRPGSARALRDLSEQGVIVVLASGRSWRTVVRIQRQIGIKGPVITHNGAYGYDTLTNREWHRHGVASARVREFIRWADTRSVMVRCYLGVGQPVVYNRFDLAHQLCWFKPEDRLVPDLRDTLDVDPLEIFISGLESVDEFVRHFGLEGPGYELIIFPHVGYREVNICAPGVNKVEALTEFSRLWQIAPDEILALGDGPNDIGMLKWAGLGVAVGDGTLALQSVADFVTAPGSVEPVLEGLRWAFPDYLSTPLNTA